MISNSIVTIMFKILRFTRRFSIETMVPLILSLIGLIIHLVFYNNLEFHRDELLYFSLGEHLDFGYHSVPPFIGLLAFIVIKIFGYTLFAAKIFPAFIGGAIIFFSALITKELKGNLYAQILTGLNITGSILFARAFSLFQPVVFDIFFWTLSIFFLTRYLNTNLNKYIIYLGISVGIGFLNKYNILFLVISLLAVIPFTRYRKLFVTKDLYISLFIAFLIVLPNLIWQFVHHFPVITHMSELKDSQLVKMSPLTFLSEQLLMIVPATLIAIPGAFFLLFGKQVKSFRVLGITSIVVILLYLLLQGKSYYTAGIYPLFIAAGSVFYEKIFKNNILRLGIISILIYLMWIFIPMSMPVYSPEKLVSYFDKMAKASGNDAIRRFEDNSYHQLPQDYADMLGWNELADITNTAWKEVINKNNCIIYAENYGEAGAITIIGKKYHLPEAISFNDNFRYWAPKTFTSQITELIYINGELGEDIKLLFDDIQEVGRIRNPLAREFGVQVYLCKNPNKSFNQFWINRMNEIIHQ
jgi:hypothetical protein